MKALGEGLKSPRQWVLEARREPPPSNLEEYLRHWETFFDHYARRVDRWHEQNAGYHKAVASIARFYVPTGARVLEIGSGNGDLLAALAPSCGVGTDISGQMVGLARSKYPDLVFHHMPAERLDLLGETFDYVVLSDLLGYLYDIREVLERVRSVCHARTRIVMHVYSRLWQPVLRLAELLGMKYPQPILNWTTPDDIRNLLHLAGFELVQQRPHILLPKRVPLVTRLVNRFLAHLPLLEAFCLTSWTVARPLGIEALPRAPRVSVVCPCRNESGNLEAVVRRLPRLGASTELIFVEGHSTDRTLQECERVRDQMPDREIRVLKQKGTGKGDAVREGFAQATGDVLVILDADLSVAPEDLPQFVDALVRGRGEMVNGSRLVYGMDPEAMRFLNLLGNRFFALALRWMLGQPVRDTLCGTKVLLRSDYERIAAGRAYFGEFDPFGDFDLLFGAAKLNLRIVDVPVRYHQRVYGQTNIQRFRHGFMLLRMTFFAAARLFFIA